jgi:ribosome-associated translation inhibitor RaiA
MTSVHDTIDVQVSSKGAVARDVRDYARAKLTRAARYARQPVLRAHVHLRLDPNPALDRPAIARAQVDVSGRLVCARVAAGDMHEAIDLLEGRIRRGLDALAGRDEGRYHETGSAPPGEWRHGDLATLRPEYFPRPVDDREIVRRKTPALGAMAPEQAILEMTLLDRDFLLFVDSESGDDAVVYRRSDGHPARLDPPSSTMQVADAVGMLDLSGERFVFFVDQTSGRGSIVYRRYDGHYGLITPGTGG